jgi:hypothetical protein
VAALASMNDERPVSTTTDGRRVSRGASSAVDLLSRLRGPLPEPEQVGPPPPRAARWEPVHRTEYADRFVLFRMELEAARREGVPFAEAWPVAQARAFADLASRGVMGRQERAAFVKATNATRREWERAYYYEGERLAVVDLLLAGLDDADDRRGGLRALRPGGK